MNMGTRFMATAEAPIHDNIKQALVDGDEMSTALVMRSFRNTERVYKNEAVEQVLALEAEHPGGGWVGGWVGGGWREPGSEWLREFVEFVCRGGMGIGG